MIISEMERVISVIDFKLHVEQQKDIRRKDKMRDTTL
jgi:hypothetical protein